MDVNSAEVRREVGRFCTDVRNALRRHWISPEEREREQEAAALRQAEEDRQRREAEAKRRVEEEARQTAAEEERRKHEAEEERTRIAAAEAEARDDEQRRQRDETKAKRRAEAEEQRRLRQSQARPLWRPPIPVLAAGSLLGVVLLGAIGAWLALSPPPAPVTPTPPGLVTPAPTQQAAAAPLSAAQERALKTGDTFQECTNCPVMVVVPAGSFTMGSPQSEPGRKDDESPQHTVTIARHFAVRRVQITVDEFSAFAKATGYDTGSKCLTADFKTNQYVEGDGLSWRNPGFAQSGAHPAACWNWNDANAYADSLSKRTGKDYRLLTEAEYEYAIRARTTSEPAPRYFFGDDEASFCRYGNGLDETAKKTIPDFGDRPILPCSDGYAYTAPTGSFLPNGFGLYEMGSNIASWTQDCYHDSYNGAPVDGSAWTGGDCSSRVVRGGSWRSGPRFLRSAIRASYAPDQRINGLGFRVGRTLLAP
jgi:formylglycine-generating enzyme required for sulfatase activity